MYKRVKTDTETIQKAYVHWVKCGMPTTVPTGEFTALFCAWANEYNRGLDSFERTGKREYCRPFESVLEEMLVKGGYIND